MDLHPVAPPAGPVAELARDGLAVHVTGLTRHRVVGRVDLEVVRHHVGHHEVPGDRRTGVVGPQAERERLPHHRGRHRRLLLDLQVDLGGVHVERHRRLVRVGLVLHLQRRRRHGHGVGHRGPRGHRRHLDLDPAAPTVERDVAELARDGLAVHVTRLARPRVVGGVDLELVRHHIGDHHVLGQARAAVLGVHGVGERLPHHRRGDRRLLVGAQVDLGGDDVEGHGILVRVRLVLDLRRRRRDGRRVGDVVARLHRRHVDVGVVPAGADVADLAGDGLTVDVARLPGVGVVGGVDLELVGHDIGDHDVPGDRRALVGVPQVVGELLTHHCGRDRRRLLHA